MAVFLNFRMGDTRKRFVSHLHKALNQISIPTRGFNRGTDILADLEGIENSMLAIVVFSENYAFSTGCLRELVRIQEMGQMVVPIFYEVDPFQIRDLQGNFASAFDEHNQNAEIDEEEVEGWQFALTQFGNMKVRWDSRNYEDESDLVRDIVEYVSDRLN